MRTPFDPKTLAIDSIGDELALSSAQLEPAFIRQRFTESRDWAMEEIEGTLIDPSQKIKAAAVLLPLVLREQGLQVLLTQRASHLNHHPGQISFPGGRIETSDSSAEQAALRETLEEIALPEQHLEILGRLPTYLTATGFEIMPIVALVRPPFPCVPDPAEVDAVFEVPFSFLMNPRHHQRRIWEHQASAQRRRFYTMPYQDYFIWGATAGILRNFFHFLRA